jgi:hypothetical protein
MCEIASQKKNSYIFWESYLSVVDSRGRIFEIDLSDYELIRPYRWYVNSDNYVCTNINNKKIKLHRFITNTPFRYEVDHINRNKLDNRQSNLRICSKADNLKNTNGYKNNSSGTNGVSWSTKKSKWVVQLQVCGKRKHFGYFNDLKEATKYRTQKELEYYGEFSPLFLGGQHGKEK